MTALRHISSLATLVLLAGCSSKLGPPDLDVTHAHGLAYEGGNLFLATHNGLVRGIPAEGGWGWIYASEDRHDYTGFASDGRGTFYGSGHPDDPRSYGGDNLGLLRSTDGGHLWEQRSLRGKMDFQALTVRPGSDDLAAYWWGAIMESLDGGRTWVNTTAPKTSNVFALAYAEEALWAGGIEGAFVRSDGNWTQSTIPGVVATLAVSRDGQTLWASQLGKDAATVWASEDGGGNWTEVRTHAMLQGARTPILFAIDKSDASYVFASDSAGQVIETLDGGKTWEVIRP